MTEQSSGRLYSFDEVRAQLTAKYQVTEPAEGQLAITLPSAKSPIRLRRVEVAGSPWIEVHIDVPTLRSLAPTPVLMRNIVLPIGNFGLIDGSLVLRQLLPLSGLRSVDLEESLSIVASLVGDAEAS